MHSSPLALVPPLRKRATVWQKRGSASTHVAKQGSASECHTGASTGQFVSCVLVAPFVCAHTPMHKMLPHSLSLQSASQERLEASGLINEEGKGTACTILRGNFVLTQLCLLLGIKLRLSKNGRWETTQFYNGVKMAQGGLWQFFKKTKTKKQANRFRFPQEDLLGWKIRSGSATPSYSSVFVWQKHLLKIHPINQDVRNISDKCFSCQSSQPRKSGTSLKSKHTCIFKMSLPEYLMAFCHY